MDTPEEQKDKNSVARSVLSQLSTELERRIETKDIVADLGKMGLSTLLTHIKNTIAALKGEDGEGPQNYGPRPNPEKQRKNSPTRQTERQRKLAHTRALRILKKHGEQPTLR